MRRAQRLRSISIYSLWRPYPCLAPVTHQNTNHYANGVSRNLFLIILHAAVKGITLRGHCVYERGCLQKHGGAGPGYIIARESIPHIRTARLCQTDVHNYYRLHIAASNFDQNWISFARQTYSAWVRKYLVSWIFFATNIALNPVHYWIEVHCDKLVAKSTCAQSQHCQRRTKEMSAEMRCDEFE